MWMFLKTSLLTAMLIIGMLDVVTVANAQQPAPNSAKPAETSSPKTVLPSRQVPVLEGAVTTLTVAKGHSQIVKFAQPVARVSIADPAVADVVALAPDQVMINGRQRGVTSFIVWDETGQEGVFDLVVQNDTAEMLSAIDNVAPDEAIDVRVTDDSFIISGQVSNSVLLDQIRQIAYGYGYRDTNFIDLTDTPQTQIALKVKIVEMSRSLARTIKTAFEFQGDDFIVSRLPSAWDPAGTVRRIAANSTNEGGLTGILDFGTLMDTAFDFQDVENKVHILAEPELITTHGRPAKFLAGGEFPFIGGVTNNGQVRIEFKEFGVKLDFTPWVNMRSGLIELKIAPEVSSLDTSNCVDTATGNLTQLVCGLLKRRTETTVQLRDGEGLMISGILKREENDTFRKIPFISKIPILGQLFQNSETDHTDTELLVLVTPKILNRQTHVGQYIEPSTVPQKVSQK